MTHLWLLEHWKFCELIAIFIAILIRLVGGSSYIEGRVEVYYNGRWGTVCDDGWDNTDAGVVCRQLGFGSSGTAVYSASFGQGSGSIWLDNVACTGSESTLASCGHLGVNVTRSCSHREDAGVRCGSLSGNHLFTHTQAAEVHTCLHAYSNNLLCVNYCSDHMSNKPSLFVGREALVKSRRGI